MPLANSPELKELITEKTGRRVFGAVRILEDTTDYMGISAGTVLRLDGHDFFVMGDAKEGRFGIDDQPKLWVKYVVDLSSGERKILKLVFHEQFTTTLGPFNMRCVRQPDKESRVLDVVGDDPRFMHGRTVWDSAGNNVRIIDLIRGESLFSHIGNLEQPHEEYFHETLPGILRKVLGAIGALVFLEDKGLQHGDVRNDHILIEKETGEYRWIDFDYSVNYLDYDLWSVGNILTYVVSKGIITLRKAERQGARDLSNDDALLFYNYRLANVRKVLPYVPEELNRILMRFSAATLDFYESLGEVERDLRGYLG